MALMTEISQDGEAVAVAENRNSRRGSERRRMQRRVTVRFTDLEHETVALAATAAGLEISTHVRDCVLQVPHSRRQKRPTVEVETLTKLQAEMNKVGSNIHQILKRVNFGDTPIGQEFRDALSGYREVVAAILASLGRVPS